MYTGTLISDLIATVELAEQREEQRRQYEKEELQVIFDMQIPVVEGEHVLVGAA